MKRQSAGHALRLSSTLLIAALTLGLPLDRLVAQEQDMTQIHITMRGSPGAEFSAHWRVTHEGETIEHAEEQGSLPAEYTFEGDTLEGTVKMLSDEGRLEVEIQKGSNRTHSSTQGKGGTLTLFMQ